MLMAFVGGSAAKTAATKEAPRSARALAYASSGDPCVDFFFQAALGATSGANVAALLDVAWSRDPRAVLRLVCHLRGVRGLGNGDREGFYAAALWMHACHPKTLAGNLSTFARFGCLKDLPEIFYRVLHGDRMEEDGDPRKQKQDGRHGTKRRHSDGEFQAAKEKRRMEEAQLVRYESDESFRFLYDRVTEMFVEMLKSDVEHLRAGDTSKIGLAAKWCPSLRSSYDRATLLCGAIARRIFPRESSQEYLNISEKHYAYRVRDRLRREVLVSLRKVLELPEVYMCACNLKSCRTRVASVAMSKYKEVFQKHDKHRVTTFFDEVRTGHARMPADGVLPHELIAAALKGEHDEAAELQWRRMAASLAAEGRLANCIAVCGLSGAAAAVADQPASAAVALGLLISELSQEPWKGSVITFGETHQLHKVLGTNLKEKLRPLVAAMGAHKKGANLQGVFSKILQLAVSGGLRKDMMVKRVFVLSDMDFDGWTGATWKTEYQGICDKFAAEGFTVPQVVFWNVGTSKASTPVVAAQEGAALVSGYSNNLVRLFLEADGELTPAAIVADAISGPEYDALELFD
ncbi:unnamed protein product [Urochloa humidicola]